jgi:hypothetical protein
MALDPGRSPLHPSRPLRGGSVSGPAPRSCSRIRSPYRGRKVGERSHLALASDSPCILVPCRAVRTDPTSGSAGPAIHWAGEIQRTSCWMRWFSLSNTYRTPWESMATALGWLNWPGIVPCPPH